MHRQGALAVRQQLNEECMWVNYLDDSGHGLLPSQAVELLFATDALAALGSTLAAQQLAALVSCGDLCGQRHMVEQVRGWVRALPL